VLEDRLLGEKAWQPSPTSLLSDPGCSTLTIFASRGKQAWSHQFGEKVVTFGVIQMDNPNAMALKIENGAWIWNWVRLQGGYDCEVVEKMVVCCTIKHDARWQGANLGPDREDASCRLWLVALRNGSWISIHCNNILATSWSKRKCRDMRHSLFGKLSTHDGQREYPAKWTRTFNL